ncbi:MAG: right-handed parallel beta-helix repeat-containing protein, partial [Saprospiraceae bacterium]
MKIILTAFLVSMSCILSATDYYVSSSTGNDNNDGLSAATAWRSVGRVNLVMNIFQAGDQILFKRGDSFNGPLEIDADGTAGNPIIFGAYDSGDKPEIGAGISINGWSTTTDPNIWRSGCRICPDEIANFYIDGVPQQIGRHPNIDEPNGGYLTVDSHTGTANLIDADLPNLPNLVGSELVYKPNRSLIIRSEITSHNAGTSSIDFVDQNAEPRDEYGYFIQNNYATLDRDGEWFWDESKSTMYLYHTGDPNALATNATYSDQALSLNFNNYITIEDLSFKNAAREAVYIINAQGIVFQNNEVSGAGTRGVVIHNTDIQFLDNLVEYSNHVGLDVFNAANSNFLRNTIRHSGTIAGMGTNSYGSYTGV